MPYELWSFAPSTLPARSRLYSLAPLGVGSSQVESITSYVMRLAGAHAVFSGTLVRTEIFPNLTLHPKRLGCAALHSLNGLSACFVQWVEVLESLTSRNDLRVLTLLPWQSVVAADGVSRRYRTWCPRCYQERREREQVVYDSLLWMLASVSACPLHEVPLAEFCPHCEKRSLPFCARGQPGFCTHCHGWLGSDLSVPSLGESGRTLVSRLQTAKEIGELLSIGSARNQPVHSHLADNIQRAIANLARGNRLLFCRVAGVNERTLMEWLSGKVRPSLALLIRVAHNLSVSLKRLLIDEIPANDVIWIQARASVEAEQAKSTIRRAISRQRFEHPVTRNSLWALSPRKRAAAKAEVKIAMEAAIKEDVPRSVRDIFRCLGYQHCVMGRYWFPELYHAIQLKRKRRFDRYQLELQLALSETPPPTVTQVAQRLGVSINSLRRACPELYSRLSFRHPDRRNFQIASVEEALKKAFEESPAPLTQLASRLHRNADKLRITYPALCAELHQRYLVHQSMERRRLESIYEKYVRQAIEEIIAAGRYPSRKRVLCSITKKDPSLTSTSRTSRVLKRIRQEVAKSARAIQGFGVPEFTTVS
jgi:transcriptional regulator with XRE-family HTH domain